MSTTVVEEWLSARRGPRTRSGCPVEFGSLERIRAAHSERGVTGLLFAGDSDVARISDDTQMTLFTAEALIQAHRRERLKGTAAGGPCWCAGRPSAGWRPRVRVRSRPAVRTRPRARARREARRGQP
ncbi:ADP-ribosylglycohydrolase family protein [Streptomyces sp. NBC_00443]